MGTTFVAILVSVLAVTVAILALIFIVVPLFKGIGWVIGGFFRGIGWLIAHVFRFIAGVLGDFVRTFGAVITGLIMIPLVLGNIVIGRWSAAAHFGRAFQDEFITAGHSIYRVFIGHPARFLLLNGLTEGIERRFPEVVAAAPGRDMPKGRASQFDGYTIVGSLKGGGSGGRLYVANPNPAKLAAFARMGREDIEQVVIKAFSLHDGSSLPQIVRESRALEAARKIGLVLEHELSNERFFYVMPYVPGDDLTTTTRRLHGDCGPEGLDTRHLQTALSYVCDLLETLHLYHRSGLWHKDIKPDNIIISRNRAHLVDLGLITPLRSAMTLTTHGTEYFRDPEMVRMALRGVKVHEVDGVKFDIYGAGAVLYSVVENSFPAHGGLSQLTRKCPESLRWIIRRSMTDIGNRYSSAEDMLKDVRYILSASDPFAIKPVELPSMRGGAGAADAAGFEPAAEAVAASPAHVHEASYRAASPIPPKPEPEVEVFGVAAGLGKNGPFARLGHIAFDKDGNPIPEAGPQPADAPRTRPRVMVTDWLTGKYRWNDGAPVPPGAGSPQPRNAAHVRNAAHQPRPRRQPGPAGRSAREQLEAARRRVHEAQKRAHGRLRGGRASSRYSNKPNAGVAAALFLFFAACVTLVAIMVKSGNENSLERRAARLEALAELDQLAHLGDSIEGLDAHIESFIDTHVKPHIAQITARSAKLSQRQVTAAADTDIDTEDEFPDSINVVFAEDEFPANPIGKVLVVNDLPRGLNPEHEMQLNEALNRFRKIGFAIEGLGNDEETLKRLAAVKKTMGLGTPNDQDTIARLQGWLDEKADPSITAVLWLTKGDGADDVISVIVHRSDLPEDAGS